jgi:hypothetical protein
MSATGSRGALNPPFGPTSGAGGRGRLDPAIFGQRRMTEDLPAQPMQHADDFVNAPRLEGLSQGHIIELISRQVARTSRGSRDCYIKWRGAHELLDANDIRDGMAKDGNMVIPLKDLQTIIDGYGGPMTMSGFVRMLGDGAKYVEKNTASGGARRDPEDEAILKKIADNVIGTQWQEMIQKSRGVEDMVRGFDIIGIPIDADVVRRLTSKLGKFGLLEAIRARIQ